MYAARIEHLECIARAVSHSENDMVCGNVFAACKRDASDTASRGISIVSFNLDVIHSALETDFAAKFDDLRSHFLNDADESKCSDMRSIDIENFFRRACLHELVEHFQSVVLWIFDLAIQLSVRESSCAAFAKLRIRFWIKCAILPHTKSVFRSLAHGLSALENNWAKTRLRQDESRKKSRWAHADHKRSVRLRGRCLRHKFVTRIWSLADAAIALHTRKQCGLIANFNIDRVHEEHRISLARIDRATENVKANKIIGRNPKSIDNRTTQCAFGMFKGKSKFVES